MVAQKICDIEKNLKNHENHEKQEIESGQNQMGDRWIRG
jgi:hypothetical protein